MAMDRETIQDVAIKTLIANNAASMHDIAAAAGIGRTTLHRYFASREELLRALIASAFDDIEQVMTASQIGQVPASQALENMVLALVPIGHRFHFLMGAWPFDESDEEFKVRELRLLEQFELLVQRGQREGTFRSDLPTRWIIDTITALLFMAWESISEGYTASCDASRLVLTTLRAGIGTK
ncbi:TetR/AcrR family transcriptional regulator [Dictyobacter formicarum]|uniref:TetR family transcriptional regulator n=1 Tax=Dictyobacter formicarum TaxID=2778368 RepID=A0ABQ3VGN9_9CHLR|nr:TetR/AcrR family transcriptional regulator [Dictyobacter formicarum]GHO85349.1 TetR family transcriptional regulator [Dictyobacter formicarum]